MNAAPFYAIDLDTSGAVATDVVHPRHGRMQRIVARFNLVRDAEAEAARLNAAASRQAEGITP